MVNLDPASGLLNGTRLVIIQLQTNIIHAEICTWRHSGKSVFIPRNTLIPSDSVLPVILQRRQFPVRAGTGPTMFKTFGDLCEPWMRHWSMPDRWQIVCRWCRVPCLKHETFTQQNKRNIHQNFNRRQSGFLVDNRNQTSGSWHKFVSGNACASTVQTWSCCWLPWLQWLMGWSTTH